MVVHRAEGQPGDLDGQIASLLGTMSSDLAVWSVLASQYQGELFVGLFLSEDNQGIGIAATTLKALAERGLRVDLDIYPYAGIGEN